jgi:hypothetical protein
MVSGPNCNVARRILTPCSWDAVVQEVAAVPARYRCGRYPQKIAHKAAPLGPLPRGRFVAVGVGAGDVVWALADRGLFVGTLEGFQSYGVPAELDVKQVTGLCVLPGDEPSLAVFLHDGWCWQWEGEGHGWARVPLGELPDIVVGEMNLSQLEREGRAKVLLQIHGSAWLAALEGELMTVGADGFVEPMPHDLARAPLMEMTKGVVAPDGTWWFACTRGICHLRCGEWEYFAGKRWLNSDNVRDIAVDGKGRLWAATEEGLCCIEYREMTLAEKAAYFESMTRRRHIRRGYACANRLAEPGEVDRYTHEASDNDGLWTALYVAAESFRYAATREEEARRFAKQSALALCRLEKITPTRGLIARAVVAKSENVIKSRGEWHETPDGQWEWKGDASSDELDGHYFAYSVYWDVAADEEGKRVVAQTVERITDHLIEHGYFLVDVDGEATTWGFFAPGWLNVTREDQRGLNSLEILAYLRTAYHICGHDRYMEHYWRLVEDHHYALNCVNQKILWPGDVNFSDDELAFCAYYPLLMYEDDSRLRQLYLLSLERQWQAVRAERCPLWNAMYGALTGKLCDIEETVRTLAELPLELVTWAMINSDRDDVEADDRFGRFGEKQSRRIVPYDERGDFRWNHNPFRMDSHGDGRTELDGTHYLLPYWLARYHGLIEESS